MSKVALSSAKARATLGGRIDYDDRGQRVLATSASAGIGFAVARLLRFAMTPPA
ncbi:hypothetical protein [Salipiger aestuarii]|uniref:hypothetical protein n=1 Tax=Salipiger aestuarii TaxID=568098 RepID=UPI00025B8AE0|nr:hypothetical protein [Salipiger aestuarii]EIE49129.1 hypothetical protein C357_19990 [Citreicella sp. 357]